MPATTMILEWAPFTLAVGNDEATLLAASDRLDREFLSTATGYLGRTLLRLPDGRFADLVFWRSRADADAILPRIAESEACGAYFGCMVGADPDDPASGISHLTPVRTYGALATF